MRKCWLIPYTQAVQFEPAHIDKSNATLYLSGVKDRELYLDLSWRSVPRIGQLSQHDMHISVLIQRQPVINMSYLLSTYRCELQTVPEHVHEYAPNTALLATERPSLEGGGKPWTFRT